MRIRYIKPDFFKDEYVSELKHTTRLLYIGLWCMADKQGRLEDSPRRIQAELFPYEKVNVESELKELVKKPFINRYQIKGVKYIQIIKWNEHQKPHHTEKESIIPESIIDLNNNSDNIKDVKDVTTTDINTEKGMGNEHDPSRELSNGELTVKEPLTNPSIKIKYLDFVYLKDTEFLSLKNKLGKEKTSGLIERLNNYIGSKGVKYKSHYHTILNWASKEPGNLIVEDKFDKAGIPR